jgi:electron transport complex protein RnfC
MRIFYNFNYYVDFRQNGEMRMFKLGNLKIPHRKHTAAMSAVRMPAPASVILPMAQHIGAPAVPCVAKGDMVKVGTKIADAGGFVSAAIFSSVSGKVAKIDSIIDASGYRKPAIFIDVQGDEWEETIDRSEELVTDCALEPAEIVAKIKDAGIVGMGGACFPTHVKLTPPPGSKAECVIINAVECEPYLTADQQLMLE